jgi:hypothetical protein
MLVALSRRLTQRYNGQRLTRYDNLIGRMGNTVNQLSPSAAYNNVIHIDITMTASYIYNK